MHIASLSRTCHNNTSPAFADSNQPQIKEINMSNMNQNPNKTENPDNAAKISAKIKETYSKLSDDDIKLYNGNRDQFFAKLKEKQNVSKEDGEKRLQEIEKSFAGEKTDAAKAA
jgi:uncharacterized protein YjbJ (UPF0337 family)